MSKLKSATTEAHRSIEGAFDVMRPDLDLARYRHWIEKFHGFYSELEPTLAAHASEVPGLDFESRKKVDSLRRDLVDCGHSEAALDSLPRASGLPTADTVARMIGIMYVVEGSSLGGRIINKHLQSVLPDSHRTATRFFSGYGQKTGEMWMSFGRLTEETLDSAAKVDEAVQAANETFEALGRWLRR